MPFPATVDKKANRLLSRTLAQRKRAVITVATAMIALPIVKAAIAMAAVLTADADVGGAADAGAIAIATVTETATHRQRGRKGRVSMTGHIMIVPAMTGIVIMPAAANPPIPMKEPRSRNRGASG